MTDKLIENKIYLYDNFFNDYHTIYNFLLKNYRKNNIVYGDSGEIFFSDHSNSLKEWDNLLHNIKKFIESHYGESEVIASNALSAVVYEENSYKDLHTDDLNIFTDQNGLQVSKRFKYTSIFYLNNNFIGGKLTFPDLDISLDAVEGRLVVFPSNYMHSVSRIESGTRFVISKFWSIQE